MSESGSIACLLLLLSAGLAHGQSTASLGGQVTDPQGKGVAGAVVTLYPRDGGLRFRTTTDESGLYRFERLGAGEYEIEVAAPGLAGSSSRSVRVESSRAAQVEISLQLAGIHEEVIVTASSTAQPVDQVSKAAAVIDLQAIQARDEYSIAEVLRSVPALRIQQLGGPGTLTTIKTRGLPNEATAVLIDGMRFRDAAAPQGDATGFLADLMVTDIDRLEVLRGSGSSLYGTNAMGGVIHIVTDEGGGRARGSLFAEGGGLGLFRGGAHIAGGLGGGDRVAYSAGVAHLNITGGVDGDDAARNTSGQGRISFRLSPTTTLSARIYTAGSFLQVNSSPQAIGNLPPVGVVPAVPLREDEARRYAAGSPPAQLQAGRATFIASVNDPDNRAAAHFFSGLVTLTQRPAEAFNYSISYQGLATRRSSRNGPAGTSFQPEGDTRSDFDGNIQTLNARAHIGAGRLNLIHAGYEFESENFINRSFQERAADGSTVDVTQRSHSLFAQEQARLYQDRLQLSAGFRTQFFSLQTPELTPATRAPYQGLQFQAPPRAYTGDGSIAYFFRKSGTKIRSHVGNSYRAPSLFERFGTSFGSFGYAAFGDPRLRPDRSIALDVGLDQALLDGRLRASATYFYTRLQEIILFDFSGAISPVTDPFGRFGGYRNAGGGLARGLELDVSGAPLSSLNLSAAYTYTNADQRTPVVAGVIRSLVIPNHQFSLVATQRIGPRLSVNLDLTASSQYLAPLFDPGTFSSRAFAFDGQAKVDLGAAYRIPIADFRSVRLFGKVDNLLNQRYYEAGFRTPGATGVGGIRFEF